MLWLGDLPRGLSKVSRNKDIPHFSLILTGAIVLLLVLLAEFFSIVSIASFAMELTSLERGLDGLRRIDIVGGELKRASRTSGVNKGPAACCRYSTNVLAVSASLNLDATSSSFLNLDLAVRASLYAAG